MSELDESGRTLLALAGDAHDPTDADRARVRAALSARLGAVAGLGVGAAVGLTATAKAAAAGATGVGSSGGATAAVAGGVLATKLTVVAVAITATVGVGATVKLVRHAGHRPAVEAISGARPRRTAALAPRLPTAPARAQEPSEAPPPEEVAPAAAAPPPAPRGPAVPSGRTMPAVPARTEARGPAAPTWQPASAAVEPVAPGPPPAGPVSPSAPLAGPASPAAVPMAAPRVAPTSPPHRVSEAAKPATTCGPASIASDGNADGPAFTVADETRLVREGVRALHGGQPACALSLFDTHAHFYPNGVLAEEREAERALTLAALGRTADARAAATAFLHKYPASALKVRLRERIPGLGADGR